MKQQGQHPQTFGQAVEHLIEPFRVGLVLGQDPGLGFLDVAVEPPDQDPDLLQCLTDLGFIEQGLDPVGDAVEVGGKERIRLGLRLDPVPVAADHRQAA